MKAFAIINNLQRGASIGTGLLFVVLCLCGCRKNSGLETGPVEPAHVTFKTVEFPKGSPQLNAIRVTQAKPFRQGEESFTGQLVWNEDCTNRVFSPVAGRIETIVAEIGRNVNKGDDLALMRSPDYGQAQADYRKATSDLAQAEKTLARVKALREHGAAAVKDVESAQADYDRAVSEKQRAELRLQLLGSVGGAFSDLYHVSAPIGGVVVDRNVNVGQEVRSDIVLASTPQLTAPMFTITDPTKLWVQLDVPEREVSKLQPGQPIEVRSSAYPERIFEGHVDLVGASLDPQTRVIHARGSIDNSEGLLKAAMYVTVTVKELLASSAEVVLPSRAVFFLDGKYFVFLETGPWKYEKREVVVKREAAGGMIIIGGGSLQVGDRVVTEGNLLLNEMLSDQQPEPTTTPAMAKSS
jgi:cobalt-zinc-cadmium efflux system membrane fusion protein